MAVTQNESEISIDRISSDWTFVILEGSFEPFPRIKRKKIMEENKNVVYFS